jgi:hypothetical protein
MGVQADIREEVGVTDKPKGSRLAARHCIRMMHQMCMKLGDVKTEGMTL